MPTYSLNTNRRLQQTLQIRNNETKRVTIGSTGDPTVRLTSSSLKRYGALCWALMALMRTAPRVLNGGWQLKDNWLQLFMEANRYWDPEPPGRSRRSRSEGGRRSSAPGRPRCVNVVDVLNIQQVNDKGSSRQMLLVLIGVIMNKMLMKETRGCLPAAVFVGPRTELPRWPRVCSYSWVEWSWYG